MTAATATAIASFQDPEMDEQFELHLFFSGYRVVWKGDRKLWIYSRFGETGWPANQPMDVVYFPEEGFDQSAVNIDKIREVFYPWFAAQERSS